MHKLMLEDKWQFVLRKNNLRQQHHRMKQSDYHWRFDAGTGFEGNIFFNVQLTLYVIEDFQYISIFNIFAPTPDCG
ncbi:hypothetical protein D3C74_457390 [compost metagenome]